MDGEHGEASRFKSSFMFAASPVIASGTRASDASRVLQISSIQWRGVATATGRRENQCEEARELRRENANRWRDVSLLEVELEWKIS